MKIGNILATLDELIQKTDQIIEQTQRLKKGLIQRLLTKGIGHSEYKTAHFYSNKISIPKGWAIIELKDFTTKIGSGITPRGGSKVYVRDGIPLIRSQNIQFDGLKLDDVAYITKDMHDEMSRTKLQNSDVLPEYNWCVNRKMHFCSSWLRRRKCKSACMHNKTKRWFGLDISLNFPIF